MKRLWSLMLVCAVMLLMVSGLWAQKEGKKELSIPDNWKKLAHVKSMVVPDKNSKLYGFHSTYINKTGLESAKKGGPYPDGTIFLTVFYDVVTEKDGSITQGKKLHYFAMKKDPGATSTGKWKYAFFDASGKRVEKDVKKECFDCHKSAKDSDYIFSKFVE